MRPSKNDPFASAASGVVFPEMGIMMPSDETLMTLNAGLEYFLVFMLTKLYGFDNYLMNTLRPPLMAKPL